MSLAHRNRLGAWASPPTWVRARLARPQRCDPSPVRRRDALSSCYSASHG